MRKLFFATLVGSIVGAFAIGAVVAWTSSTPSSAQQANAGTLSVALYSADSTSNALYPTGNPIAVLSGGIQNNTPANPGINVYTTGGSVSGITPSNGGCSGITGSVAVLNNSQIAPGGNVLDDTWRVDMTMPTGASDACQGNTVGYNLTIDVATP